MIKTKLYLYDKNAIGYKGEDFSPYILLGDTETNDLTEELDTREITVICGIGRKEAFEPTTKFIAEIWEDDSLVETQHWVVSNDLVEKPILSDDNYYKHHLSLIEPSAIAQQRTCDSFSITYKLSDVNLEVSSTIDTSIENYDYKSASGDTLTTIYSYVADDVSGTPKSATVQSSKVYEIEYYNDEDSNAWRHLKQYQKTNTTITLNLPRLKISHKDTFSPLITKLGYCSYDLIVKKVILNSTSYLAKDGSWTGTSAGILVHPSTQRDGVWVQDPIFEKAYLSGRGFIFNRVATENEKHNNKIVGARIDYVKQVAKYDALPDITSITFNIEEFAQYEITIRLHNFENPTGYSVSRTNANVWWDNSDNSSIPSGEFLRAFVGGYWRVRYDSSEFASTSIEYKGQVTAIGNEYSWSATVLNNKYTSLTNPSITLRMISYVDLQDAKSYFIASAPPVNAYDLLLKSIISSQPLIKTQSNWQEFLNSLTFYISDSDRLLLEGTQIVEAIYHQKNLWEMLIEIGKYIHSIPRIEFGDNDRFIIKWQKLGVAGVDNTGNDIATKISIYNSKRLEEYISSCDSYINNMVQLGGIIDEWVAPKSNSEDYIVSNDESVIKTSKPILEIVDMEVKCANYNDSVGIEIGAIRNLVGNDGSSSNGYVFESSIYQLLSINATANINKGLAIYYELGNNEIKGLSYQLPTTSSGDPNNEYAIKKIIGTVFNLNSNTWKYIKVNDFVFHIRYRTKDSLREVQTRPDLRKYLLNSSFDRYPMHKQFNNQTDLVLDSIKFGNNIYGKLIKTGNLNYQSTEWCSSMNEVKKVGELYEINGNLYYLSKITKVYSGTQIICQLEYSKDYNQLSSIIGIPSEPRFYEISERNIIQRELSWDDYLVLGTDSSTITPPLNRNLTFLQELLFSNKTSFPKYSVVATKNIKSKPLNSDKVKGNEDFQNVFMLPLISYSCRNTLTFECDTIDNFSAGDMVSNTEYSPINATTNNAYKTLLPYQYCDPMGRADMYEFAILSSDISGNYEAIRNLPECPFGKTNPLSASDIMFATKGVSNYLIGNSMDNEYGIVALKDSREQLSFNYNIQMLTDSDRFVLSGYLWQLEKAQVGLVLLNDEINKLSNDTISSRYIIGYDGNFNNFAIPLQASNNGSIITIDIKTALESKFTQEQIEQASAIAIISSNASLYNTNEQYFVMGRNIRGLDYSEKTINWYIKEYDVSKAKTN